MRKALGAILILTAAAAVLLGWLKRRKQTAVLLMALIGDMERIAAAIRWQKQPFPQILEALSAEPYSGVYYQKIEEIMKSNIPLHAAWNKVFSKMQPKEAATVLCGITLQGDEEALLGSLLHTAESLREIEGRRRAAQREEAKLYAASVLSAAGMLIILLI